MLWEQTMVNMANAGVDTFIEIGPGRTLTSFVKKTLPRVTAMNVEDLASLDALRAAVSRVGTVAAAPALAAATVATAGAGAGGGVW